MDDCLYALQATIPHLTRSSLHRCLQRNGISPLPQVEGEKTARRRLKSYPLGYFDIAEVRTEQGKLYLFVAIDRTTTPGVGGSAVPLIKEAIASGERVRAHSFELACAQNDIEHRLTKPRHPWTNGQSLPRRRPGSSG